MPPNLTKKKQQDEHRRPNIWRYIAARRLGRGGRRGSTDDDDNEVRQRISDARLEESDRSDSIHINEDADADADSVCSDYSDAHSTWEHPSTTTGDNVLSLVAKERPKDATTVAPRSEPSGSSGQRVARAIIDETRDSVVSIEAPPLEMIIPPYATQDTRPLPNRRPKYAAGDTALRSDTEDGIPDDNRYLMQARLDKGKGVEDRLDWSTAVNPWALLDDSSSGPGIRDDLVEENARLRAEIQELKAMVSMREEDAHVAKEEPKSPGQSPVSLRAASRAKRSRQKKRQDAILFETTTLRDLVLKRLFTPHVLADGMLLAEDTPVNLDTPLTPTQIHDFTQIMNEVITSGKNLKQPIALCAVCHLPKFKGAKGSSQNSYVSEVLAQLPTVSASAFEDFDPTWGTSSCCRRYVCKTCLSAAIIAGISTQWWFDLSNQGMNWLKCPVPVCGRSLPLHSILDVLNILQVLGIREAPSYTERFEQANKFRSKLQSLSALPSKEELRRSKVLHDRLIRYKRMWPLLDSVPENINEEPISVELLSVDTADGRGTMKMAIFTHLLRPRTPRTCVVCDETYREFHRGNPQSWSRATRGFRGEWTWRLLSFPAPEILVDCQHEYDICRNCLGTYITAQLETQGHSAVDNISCPTPSCNHKFTHGEVRHLATPESFAVYDRYTVLNSVSSLPNFRWCLREDCTAGGLYDDPSSVPASSHSVNVNCIECSECNFTMCYTCQSPWHANLTCEQYASQRGESFTETQTWLAEHTKPCPGEGCGVQVQKGDGCFHMTCSRCRFEFCWECLTDWRRIFVPGDEGGFLRASGHREGCFFRGEGAPLPTQVMGQDLATGLRRLEGGAAAG
jgi:hypothetical protein